MPELPEVETVCLFLTRYIIGRKIRKCWSSGLPLRKPIAPDLLRDFAGARVQSIIRKGKYLLLYNQDSDANTAPMAVWHLGMSGSFRWHELAMPRLPHTHVSLEFEDGRLDYIDPRRFGFVLKGQDPDVIVALRSLGPEPLSRHYDGRTMHQALARRSVAVKNALLDQRILAGVGNIYATEALWLSGIAPHHVSNTLSLQECYRLCSAVKTVLKSAIDAGGSTLNDHRQPDGQAGYFQHQWRAYGVQRVGQCCGWRSSLLLVPPGAHQDKGERCRSASFSSAACQGVIASCRIGGRSSNYCPVHQE